MKATLTCYKDASGKFNLLAAVERSEELINYEGVILDGAGALLEAFWPTSINGDDSAERLSHTGFLRRPVEVGDIAVFLFKYETAAGCFEIGEACPIE